MRARRGRHVDAEGRVIEGEYDVYQQGYQHGLNAAYLEPNQARPTTPDRATPLGAWDPHNRMWCLLDASK